ncbi:hypothetical protein TNCV_1804431 [Trichonephila clavipes]|nr:hypothetical protein TNCV_1804431 [Trichonephila clavipes]
MESVSGDQRRSVTPKVTQIRKGGGFFPALVITGAINCRFPDYAFEPLPLGSHKQSN